MNTKFRKWKFTPTKKVFIKNKKLKRWIKKGNLTIYDTRDSISFKLKKLKGSKNISPSSIKKEILWHDKKDKIVLVGKGLRTNMIIASWARFEGYKNVLLVDNNIRQSKIIKK